MRVSHKLYSARRVENVSQLMSQIGNSHNVLEIIRHANVVIFVCPPHTQNRQCFETLKIHRRYTDTRTGSTSLMMYEALLIAFNQPAHRLDG